MLKLDEIKKRLIEKYNLQVKSTCGVSSFSIMQKLSEKMMENPEKVEEIENNISQGEPFRYYFTDKESIKDFLELHDTDVDRFYRILRKEELFFNTCLQTFGFKNVIISLDPKTLLSSFDCAEDDFDDETDEYK